MIARYIQRGDAIDYKAVYDIAAGDIVVLAGKLIGVAKLDIKAGELGELALTGVYEVRKSPAAMFVEGEEVAWNEETRMVVPAGWAGSIKMGHAIASACADDYSVAVRLCPGLK